MVRLRVRGGSVVGCSARGATLGIHLLLCKLCRLSMSVIQSNKSLAENSKDIVVWHLVVIEDHDGKIGCLKIS
jgi:hypothetical protein